MPWYLHVIALLAGVVLPGMTLLRGGRAKAPVPRYESAEKIAGYWSNGLMMLLFATVAAGAWRLGGGNWQTIGVVFPGFRLGPGLAGAAVFIGSFAADSWWRLTGPRLPATRRRWQQETPFMPATVRELKHSIAMVVGASVGEELVYRGFLIGYLVTLAGDSPLGPWLAVLLPATAFGVSHWYQGKTSAIKIGVSAILLGVIVVMTGSLWIAIAVHFLADLTAMVLGLRLMQPPRAANAESDGV